LLMESEPNGFRTTEVVAVRARVNEIERQLTSLEFRILWMRYLALPIVVLATVAMTVGLILGVGSRSAVIGGALGLATAGIGMVSFLRGESERLADLVGERDELLAEGRAPLRLPADEETIQEDDR